LLKKSEKDLKDFDDATNNSQKESKLYWEAVKEKNGFSKTVKSNKQIFEYIYIYIYIII
jgi:hypothetical protein